MHFVHFVHFVHAVSKGVMIKNTEKFSLSFHLIPFFDSKLVFTTSGDISINLFKGRLNSETFSTPLTRAT